MTLVNALNELKANGINAVTGFGEGLYDIDDVIDHAKESHANAIKWADKYQCWRYTLDHEDDNFIVVTDDGHYIIATHYDGFDIATYSDYNDSDEMNAMFEAWEIQKQAEEIADQKIDEGSTMPREALVLVAASMLTDAMRAAHEAFERDYGKKDSRTPFTAATI